MPLQTSELSAELKELKEMNQQPSSSVGLVWFSGLTAPQRQQLTSAVFELRCLCAVPRRWWDSLILMKAAIVTATLPAG